MKKLNQDIESDSETTTIDNETSSFNADSVHNNEKQTKMSLSSASQSSILADAMYEVL